MRDLSSPSEMMRQDSRDERMLRDEQNARWSDEPDGITRCAGCGCDVATLVQGLCPGCRA